MDKTNLFETILIVAIAFLFCFPMFLIYNIQQDRINNLEDDLTDVKKEIYQIKMDIATMPTVSPILK